MTLDDAWSRFDACARTDAGARIIDQFTTDPDRLARMSLTAAGLYLDLSKQNWTREGFDACLELARAAGVEAARARLFAGDPVNVTEHRAALHPALRAGPGADFHDQGQPISEAITAARTAMDAYAEAIRSSALTGATGKPFRAVIHIGIGGSGLGPRMVWEALAPARPDIAVRFVANIDPADMAEAVRGLDPETTLVVVVSKTFTTQETLTNAERARAWLAQGLEGLGLKEPALEAHFTGVTSAPERAAAFGCGRTFAMCDWVGGRFSLWSSAGLSCVIGLGPDAFHDLLAGARAMDAHFLSAPLEANGPVLMALAQVWNVDGLGRPTRTVAPYAHHLRRLPAFLQQLEMESNGKRVRLDGSPVTRGTCPVVFGEPGTNGQHAFFQQLHQGPNVTPAEFVVVAEGDDGDLASLWANAIAQGQALMLGRSHDQAFAALIDKGMAPDAAARLAPHKTFPGNRPSTTVMMRRLTPQTLGALIALYEHKVFVEGVIWGINSFDQWGVELGKALAQVILDDVAQGAPAASDPSTAALVERLTENRNI